MSDRPTWVAQLELGSPRELESIRSKPSVGCRDARVLVRLHGDPMGFVEMPMPPGGLTADDVARVAWPRLERAVRSHLVGDGLAYPERPQSELLGTRDECRASGRGSHPPISVVICTRDRAQLLRTCLHSLQQLQYPDFDVLVVDNAPTSDATLRCFEEVVGDDSRFRHVVEPAPGLSVARNRGLAEASRARVAFTDDDVTVDPWWLHGLARGFARGPEVACVTGIVVSALLDTEVQRYFDRRTSVWAESFEPRVYDLGARRGDSPLYPYAGGTFGTGGNLCVDRELAMGIGGFDEELGTGSPARGGEDLDWFVRVVRAGRAIAYEPSALVWHDGVLTSEARQQLRGYGVGLGAYLAKYLRDPSSRWEVLRRAPRGMAHMIGRWRDGRRGGDVRMGSIWTEAWGIATGPVAYRRSRRAARGRDRLHEA